MKRRANVMVRLLYEWLVIIFFISVQIAFRVLVGFSTIGMLALALLYQKLDTGKWWNRSFVNLFTLGCFLYFALQTIALMYTRNVDSGMCILQTNLSLIALSVGVSYSRLINPDSWGRLMKWYTLILLCTTLVALGYAGYAYTQTGNIGVFFYHPLVFIYSDQAIQFSILVFIGILFLIEESGRLIYIKNRKRIIYLLIYFSIILFLLTSKLVITIYFLFLVYLVFFTKEFSVNRLRSIAGLVIILTTLVVFIFTNSLLRQRMTEDVHTDFTIIKKDKFNPGDYLNGIQFRLISWRLVFEILHDNHRWWLGVGPGDAQDMLGSKYRKMNLYIGGSAANKNGYLIYHTHNQFLQALLETGIIGLAAFLLICVGMVQLAFRSRNRSMAVLTIFLLCYCFSDAVLKTQYGIILFVFFPLFLFRGKQTPVPLHQSL